MIQKIFSMIEAVPWSTAWVAALSLGLAPFFPKPHVVEKLQMLFAGTLRRPIDIFDLFFHGLPWVLLILKVVVYAVERLK